MSEEIDQPGPRLTTRQKLFIEHYLGGAYCNGSEAARRAGYKQPGLEGWRLMQNEAIKAAIAERVSSVAMTADEVLHRLSSMGRGSVVDVINDEGRIDVREAQANGKDHLIKKLKQTRKPEGEVVEEVELYDAQAALVHLGRHLNLFAAGQGLAEGEEQPRRYIVEIVKAAEKAAEG